MSPAAFLFDLDGTLVDSVYQHVVAWREALTAAGLVGTRGDSFRTPGHGRRSILAS